MRILQVTHQYPPHHVGGVELITHTLAHQLHAHGHEMHVLTRAPTGAPAISQEGGVTVHRIVQNNSKTGRFLATFVDVATARAAQDVIHNIKPNLVHIQHLMGFPADTAHMLAQQGVPYVVSLHDYWFVCANAQRITNDMHALCDGPSGDNCGRCMAARAGLPSLLAPLAMPLANRRNDALRKVLDGAQTVIANSQFVLDWFGAQNFDVSGWQRVRYGLDRPAQILRTPSPNRFRVAYVGGLSWQKGVHVLIEAFNALPSDAELHIAGDEAAFPEYSAMLRAKATHAGIRFLGKQTREQVWQLLAKSDVVAVPALWHETSSLITQEGLAAGCFVIASHVGAIGEAITGSKRGALVAPGDVAAWRTALQHAYQERPVLDLPTWRSQAQYTQDIAAVYGAITA